MQDHERRLLVGPGEGTFSAGEVAGLDEPVRRWFTASVRAGAPLARSARLTMRGEIRLGRWLPFRAHEILAPLSGFVWRARVAGVISGYDRYVAGHGELRWRLAGVVPVMRASGPDVDRSAAARAAAEGVWVPTALLPRFGVRWRTTGADEIEATIGPDGTPVDLRQRLDRDGHVVAAVLDRWGDPDRTGRFGVHPFGGEFSAPRTFGDFTVPSRGRLGWHFGTDRWPDGEFFRYELTALEPVLGTER